MKYEDYRNHVQYLINNIFENNHKFILRETLDPFTWHKILGSTECRNLGKQFVDDVEKGVVKNVKLVTRDNKDFSRAVYQVDKKIN